MSSNDALLDLMDDLKRRLRAPASPEVRGYAVWVRGFASEPICVHVRARSRGRARYLCALAYSHAGYGSIGDGLRSITCTRLDASMDDRALVRGDVNGEGLVRDP